MFQIGPFLDIDPCFLAVIAIEHKVRLIFSLQISLRKCSISEVIFRADCESDLRILMKAFFFTSEMSFSSPKNHFQGGKGFCPNFEVKSKLV